MTQSPQHDPQHPSPHQPADSHFLPPGGAPPGGPPPGGPPPDAGTGAQRPGRDSPGGYPYPGSQPTTSPASGTDDRVIAVLAHLSPIIAAVVSAGTLSWLGPLILWLIYKDRDPLVRNASATSFNFHLTVWLSWVVALILFLTVIGIPVAIVIWVVTAVAQIVMSIIGALRAWNGERYTYPFQIPLLRS